ncbi:hypothetical protein ACKWTF_005258 [Chironomus riparius]
MLSSSSYFYTKCNARLVKRYPRAVNIKNCDRQTSSVYKARVYIVNCQQQKGIANLGFLCVNCFSEIELNCSHNSLQFDYQNKLFSSTFIKYYDKSYCAQTPKSL